MLVKIGSYIGNGVDGRSIVGIGFQPDFVIVKNFTNATLAVLRPSTLAGDLSFTPASNSASIADMVQALEADGFQVGANASVNTNTDVYDYIAIKANSMNDVALGSYVGDAVDGRDIVISPAFQPDFVIVKRSDANGLGLWRGSSHTLDDSSAFSANVNQADGIQALNADGFEIGGLTVVNFLTATYHYICLKNVPAVFKVGVYAGNSTDDRSISGLGFGPEYVSVKSDSAVPTTINTSRNTTDISPLWTAVAAADNRVQSLLIPPGDGFQVGTDARVNVTGNTYYWFAGKNYMPRQLPLLGVGS